MERDNPKESWKYIKILKKKCAPRTVSMQDSLARTCNYRETADVLAGYLESDHWAPPSARPPALPVDGEEIPQDKEMEAAQPFELRELENAVRQLKNH